MPLVDSNDPALWDGGPNSLYRACPTGTQIGYERAGAQSYLGDNAEQLRAALEGLGLNTTHRLVFIGAGFGFVQEVFLAAGYGPVADGTPNGKLLSVDTSTWIQSNKNGNANVPVIDADVNAATGRRIIRQQFGSNNAQVHWVVSEDVLPILIGAGPSPSGNNEIVPFCQNLRSLADNVAHWVTITDPQYADQRLNWKTLQEWKNWVTPDWVIQRDNGAVL